MRRPRVILFLVLVFCCMDVLAAEPETLQDMIRASKTRSEMVSAARQAVVHIEVEKVIEKRDPMASSSLQSNRVHPRIKPAFDRGLSFRN